MAAKDNINPQLFHGTPKPFSARTRKVHPFAGSGHVKGGWDPKWKLAHATSDINEARKYGPVVYEVAFDDNTQEGFGNTAYFSEKGFNIIRRVE